MLAHQRHANKRPFKWCFAGRPMIGHIYSVVVFGSSLPSSTKNGVKVGPPLAKLSGSAHAAFMCEVRFCAPRLPRATQLLKQQQHVAWKRLLWSWTSCCPWDFNYAPLSAADNISREVGPGSGPTKSLNAFIHKKGADKNVWYAGWSATLLVSYNEVGVHTSTDVW